MAAKKGTKFRWYWLATRKKNRRIWQPRNHPSQPFKGRMYQQVVPFDWSHLHFWKSDEWKEIQEFLKDRRDKGIYISPHYSLDRIFKAFELTPFNNAKILILGQEPYAKEGKADDIAFSCLPNRREIPGEVKTLFRSYRRDTGFPHPRSGSLRNWCRNGIFMGNTLWTVEREQRRSHYFINGRRLWQKLTEEVIQVLAKKKDKFVFIFMGEVAREHAYLVKKTPHLVMELPHPNPLNRFRKPAFEEYEMFKKSCEHLEIDHKIWRLP